MTGNDLFENERIDIVELEAQQEFVYLCSGEGVGDKTVKRLYGNCHRRTFCRFHMVNGQKKTQIRT
ncbi:TPA: hypothetical protein EYO57_34165 [Candidatus Poribacteria bacterium]|nr:hypothetical protein [Candidatus Poribacteria bacterium]